MDIEAGLIWDKDRELVVCGVGARLLLSQSHLSAMR